MRTQDGVHGPAPVNSDVTLALVPSAHTSSRMRQKTTVLGTPAGAVSEWGYSQGVLWEYAQIGRRNILLARIPRYHNDEPLGIIGR